MAWTPNSSTDLSPCWPNAAKRRYLEVKISRELSFSEIVCIECCSYELHMIIAEGFLKESALRSRRLTSLSTCNKNGLVPSQTPRSILQRHSIRLSCDCDVFIGQFINVKPLVLLGQCMVKYPVVADNARDLAHSLDHLPESWP